MNTLSLFIKTGWNKLGFLVCISLLLFSSCKEAPEPRLDEVIPRQGVIGQIITVKGSFLGYRNGLYFGTTLIEEEIVTGGNDELSFRVPEGFAVGDIEVYLLTDEGKSKSVLFSVLPSIFAVEPLRAGVGEEIVIRTNFPGIDIDVLFAENVSGEVLSESDGEYRVRVPENATSGPLQIILPDGTAILTDDFTVETAPSVSTLTPSQGWPGRILKVEGENFIKGEMTVTFPTDVSAQVEFISFEELSLIVPEGAESGFVRIQNPYGRDSVEFQRIPSPAELPFISQISPSVISTGCLITITGGNFDLTNTSVSFASAGGNIVLGPDQLTLSASRDSILDIVVPEGANSGPITITTSSGTSDGSALEIVERPSLIRTLPQGNNRGGQLILDIENGQLVEKILIGEEVILPDNNAFEYKDYGEGGEIIATNVPTEFPANNGRIEVPLKVEMAPGCESNTLTFTVGTDAVSPNAPLVTGGPHTVIIPSGTGGLSFINNSWTTAKGDFTSEESLTMRNDEYDISFCGCTAPNGDVLLYSLFDSDAGCDEINPRPCSENPIFLGKVPDGRIKPDGSFIAIRKRQGYNFVGKFDDAFEEFGSVSMVMSPVDFGDQVVFNRPGFITSVSPASVSLADSVFLSGRMNPFDELRIVVAQDTFSRFDDFDLGVQSPRKVSFLLPDDIDDLPLEAFPATGEIFFFNSTDSLFSNKVNIQIRLN